jgi:RNA-directed DNA polymerase
LDALAAGILTRNVNWVINADIRDCFTGLDQSWLARFLEHRIAEPSAVVPHAGICAGGRP